MTLDNEQFRKSHSSGVSTDEPSIFVRRQPATPIRTRPIALDSLVPLKQNYIKIKPKGSRAKI